MPGLRSTSHVPDTLISKRRPYAGQFWRNPSMASATDHEPHGRHQSKKAAASAWIGSALEDYHFFISAAAASLIFPQLFFPSGNPTVAIVASLATYGVGYVSRPIGAFFLGHWRSEEHTSELPSHS